MGELEEMARLRACTLLAALWAGLVLTHALPLEGEVHKLSEGDGKVAEHAVGESMKPDEEAKALAAEDHDANIKKIQAQELAKAQQKASDKTQKVPESVECYWALEQQARDQKGLSEKYGKIAEIAHRKYGKAAAAKQKSFVEAQASEKKHHSERQLMEKAQRSYKLEHTKAMNAYDTAKGNLDNYNIERKKVDMDSNRAKSVLRTYLKYKKRFIAASANAQSPKNSKEVQQYQKLSAQYLRTYHGLQAKIKQSYGAATKYQALYNELSKRYQKMSETASEFGTEVAKLGDKPSRTVQRLHRAKATYEQHATAATNYKARWEEKRGQSLAALRKYKALAARVLNSKTNYFKMTAMAARYTKLGDMAKSKAALNQMRFLNFERDSAKASKDIEAAVKKSALLKHKYEVADAAGVVFTKSYRMGNCNNVAEEKTSKLFTLKLLQLGEAEVSDKAAGSSASQCASDKAMASTNLEAGERSKLQHKQELTYLHMLREEHETAVSGAKTAKIIRDASRTKASRYHKVGASAKESSANVCT